MVVGLLDNESPDSNRLTLVTPKYENDVRLQATLGNQNPIGLPVGVVRFFEGILVVEMDGFFKTIDTKVDIDIIGFGNIFAHIVLSFWPI